jgi:hypothetical protein
LSKTEQELNGEDMGDIWKKKRGKEKNKSLRRAVNGLQTTSDSK